MQAKSSLGFTLIELLVVIAIIGILAVIVILQIAASTTNARFARMESDISTAAEGIENFKTVNDTPPMVQNLYIPNVTHPDCIENAFAPFYGKNHAGYYFTNTLASNYDEIDDPNNSYGCITVPGTMDSGFGSASNGIFSGNVPELPTKITSTGLKSYEYEYFTRDCMGNPPTTPTTLALSQYPDYVIMAIYNDNGNYDYSKPPPYSNHPLALWIYDGSFYSSNNLNDVQDMSASPNFTPRNGQISCFQGSNYYYAGPNGGGYWYSFPVNTPLYCDYPPLCQTPKP